MSEGVPLWRLIAPDGQVAECYLDRLVNGEWMLLVWRAEVIVVAEVHQTQESGAERAAAVRSGMEAEGWKAAKAP